MTAEGQGFDSDPRIEELLPRWQAGDREALNEILQLTLPWLRQQARRSMGDLLRQKGETLDYVEEAVVELLRYQPRLPVLTPQHFRGLMLRILKNTLRDKHQYFRARRRTSSRERPLPTDSNPGPDSPRDAVNTPSKESSRGEELALVLLAMELLSPSDRAVITLRHFMELPYRQVGAELGVDENTARMRFSRAFPRLVGRVRELSEGKMDQALSESPEDGDEDPDEDREGPGDPTGTGAPV